MELISSDTNVWVDFAVINRLNLPFLLPYTYIMYEESMDNELIYPPGIREDLRVKDFSQYRLPLKSFLLPRIMPKCINLSRSRIELLLPLQKTEE